MESFSDRLKQARKNMGLSQIQLARLSKLSQTTISDIERGRNVGSRDILALASALKVTPDWLLYGKVNEVVQKGVVEEFAWVYAQSSKDGKTFLENAVKVAAEAFVANKAQKQK